MLKNFPIFFDTTEIKPAPAAWGRSYENIEEINTTEAGTDDVEVIRRGKSTISCSFRCSSVWASIFANFNLQPMIDVRFYDIATKGYVTLTMRMDGFSAELLEYSDTIDGTHGLYNVSFDLLEF